MLSVSATCLCVSLFVIDGLVLGAAVGAMSCSHRVNSCGTTILEVKLWLFIFPKLKLADLVVVPGLPPSFSASFLPIF